MDTGLTQSEMQTVRKSALEVPHICVCICTYKRPKMLERLLVELEAQETAGRFTYSVVVADNDRLESARDTVAEFAQGRRFTLKYCVEPEQGISRARNRAVENAPGDYVAFIDDDEFPSSKWLLNLLNACERYKVDGVVGPVLRHFEEQPPSWISRGNFYVRPKYQTGTIIDWMNGRTNNVLVLREALLVDGPPFRPEFRTGEDQDYFRRAMKTGRRFAWCNEATAYEVVPPIRWKRSFLIRRALLQGAASVLHSGFGVSQIARSLIAIPLYTLALPFALLGGQHRFMALVIKLADHVGRMLAVLKINPIKEQYVVE